MRHRHGQLGLRRRGKLAGWRHGGSTVIYVLRTSKGLGWTPARRYGLLQVAVGTVAPDTFHRRRDPDADRRSARVGGTVDTRPCPRSCRAHLPPFLTAVLRPPKLALSCVVGVPCPAAQADEIRITTGYGIGSSHRSPEVEPIGHVVVEDQSAAEIDPRANADRGTRAASR